MEKTSSKFELDGHFCTAKYRETNRITEVISVTVINDATLEASELTDRQIAVVLNQINK
jgi:hypothetical protein